MADFQELIKNFERVRSYMRQFYIYGFKVRSDYDVKSARTYDNERRRIESWLGDYIHSGYSAKGKQVAINVDSRQIFSNPLYAAWKSKSFTDNDIMLHFFLLDLLREGGYYSVSEACDRITEVYGVLFDVQTVRLKCKEYERLGIFSAEKQGRQLYYHLAPYDSNENTPLYASVMTAVTFFQEAAPFGFVGNTLLDREETSNRYFTFKHHFIVHTLEDQVLLDTLTAMRQHREISFQNTSNRSGRVTSMSGLPLKIFVSTQTGRRYVCIYQERSRRFTNIRLDAMSLIKLQDTTLDYEDLSRRLNRNLPRCWGVSFGGSTRMEEIYIKLRIDEKTESHILDRLHREGRGGEVLKVAKHTYLYSGTYFDSNEMLSWIKTFTGRILDIQGSNELVIRKLEDDLDKMYMMYCNT